MTPAEDPAGIEKLSHTHGQDPNSGEQLTTSKRTPPPAPGSPDHEAWVLLTVTKIKAAEVEDSPTTLVERVIQYQGVITQLLREKKTWPVIARLLAQEDFCVDAAVLRVTYKRVQNKRGFRGPKRRDPAQPLTMSTPTQRSDPAKRHPTTPSDTPANLSGRVR